MTDEILLLARRPRRLRPLVEAFIPAAAVLDEAGIAGVLARADAMLAARPGRLRRQVTLALRGVVLLAAARFFSPFERIPADRLRCFLETLHEAPVLKLRLAVWGLRTLIFAGYYGDLERQGEIGYRPHKTGWAAVAGGVDDAAH